LQYLIGVELSQLRLERPSLRDLTEIASDALAPFFRLGNAIGYSDLIDPQADNHYNIFIDAANELRLVLNHETA